MDGTTCLVTGATSGVGQAPPYTLDTVVHERLWSVSEALAGLRYSL